MFCIPALDIEMRRRLWWQICILDVRIAEDRGTDPSILDCSFNTKLPSNLNDSSLDPDMNTLPANRPGRTEMLFSLVRFEISYFVRKLLFSEKFSKDNSYRLLTSAQKSAAIDELGHKLQKQYLAYCDRDIPFDFITTSAVRLILAKLKLMISRPLPRHREQDSTRALALQEGLLKTSVEILEHAYTLRAFERGKKWLWLFQTYVEWDALAYLLIHLCVYPLGAAAELAWTAVEKVYHDWKNNSSDVKFERRWQHIERLRSNALTARTGHGTATELEPVVGDDDNDGYDADGNDNSHDDDGDVELESPRVEQSQPEHRQSLRMDHASQHKMATMPTPPSALATDNRPAGPDSAREVVMNFGPSTPMLEKNGAAVPTSGTACEWSSAIFEQYFQGMNWGLF